MGVVGVLAAMAVVIWAGALAVVDLAWGTALTAAVAGVTAAVV